VAQGMDGAQRRGYSLLQATRLPLELRSPPWSTTHGYNNAQGSNVVVLEPDVAKDFPNAQIVNASLRGLAKIIRRRKSLAAK